MANSLLLPTLLANSIPASSHPTLLVITDSILQPGLLLLRQFISTASDKNEAIVVLSLEQIKSRLVPRKVDETRLQFIDTMSAWTPSASSSSTDIQQAEFLAVQQAVVQTVRNAVTSDAERVFVVFDSANEIAEYGLNALHSLVRTTLSALEPKKGSRLLVLHHSNLPASRLGDNQATDIANVLSSPSLSHSHVHLVLHPSPLIESLSRDYGLSIPLDDDSDASLDVRLTSFLHSFASRSWADPLVVPTRHGEQDERIPLDLGGREADSQGRCVVEWSTRGVNVSFVPSFIRKNDSGTKRIVNRGLEGLQRTHGGVEPVELSLAVDRKKMRLVDICKLSSAAPSAGPTATTTTTTTSESKQGNSSGESLLPFNLSLTDAQHSAREGVALPFTPREDGGMYKGGAITYQAESEDDIDDEDPDEDLEI
ncbi:hypothetical protein ACM66B_001322 [Microbotryomycetes sp. NB124-2]